MEKSFSNLSEFCNNCSRSYLATFCKSVLRQPYIKWNFVSGTIHLDGTYSATFDAPTSEPNSKYLLKMTDIHRNIKQHYSVIYL